MAAGGDVVVIESEVEDGSEKLSVIIFLTVDQALRDYGQRPFGPVGPKMLGSEWTHCKFPTVSAPRSTSASGLPDLQLTTFFWSSSPENGEELNIQLIPRRAIVLVNWLDFYSIMWNILQW